MSDSKGKSSTHGAPSLVDNPTDSFLKRYKVIEKIGEGSYSEVLKCKNREKGDIVACKRLKHIYRSWSQVNDIAEITTLRTLARHANILQMVEIHYDQSLGKVSLVFELMEMNLYELIKDRKRLLAETRVRYLMFQLMRALRHLHKNGIFHRDIKPENILLKPKSDLLKLGDLGSVRGLYSRPPYTEYISTRWYRSPECLLTAGYYSFKMDIWAAGCVFYEILTLRPLFPGSSELDQINRIHALMGTPAHKVLQKFAKQADLEKMPNRNRSQQIRWDMIQTVLGDANSKYEFADGKSKNFDWYFTGKDNGGLERILPPHISSDARDLLKLMLCYDPDCRQTAHRVLQHAYFNEVNKDSPKEIESKCPVIEVFGDAKGKEMISQHYQFVDLKTLGDKKHAKRRRETHYTTLHKKPEIKTIPKKSSPILTGAESPATPSAYAYKGMNIRKPLNPMKASGIELLKQKHSEKQQEEMKRSQVNTKMSEKHKGDRVESLEDENIEQSIPSTSPEKPPMKVTTTTNRAIPDTLAAKKRQVLAGNLSPSIFKSMGEAKTSQTTIPPVDNDVDVDTENLSKKVINHKLTSGDLKKINEARQLVQMDPIRKLEARKSVLSLEKESPYTKPPAELSLAGKKKVLMQRMKNNSPNAYQKRLDRLKVDSSTMHVPPQVAAAALKYTSQGAAAARQARVPLAELPVKKRNIPNEKQPVDYRFTGSEYSIAKNRFGMTRVSGVTEDSEELSPQLKLHMLMDQLQKKVKPIATTVTEASSILADLTKRKASNGNSSKSKDVPPAADRNGSNMTNIYQTLELDKQNRLSVRRKEEMKKSNQITDQLKTKMPPYTKYVAHERSKDSQNNEKDIAQTKSKPSGAGNIMFPRNRFGMSGPTDSSKRKPMSNSQGDKFNVNQVTKVYPVRHDLNMNTLSLDGKGEDPEVEERPSKMRVAKLTGIKEYGLSRSKTMNEVAATAAHRLGISLPSESEFKKPPLPPSQFRRPIDAFKDLHNEEPKNLKGTRGVSNSLERTIRNKSLLREPIENQNYQNIRKTRNESLNVIETTEAIKRRAERIRAQLREDVYCSSDDDIVSTLRQKFDDLISERAKRFSDSSSESKIIEDEDGNYIFQSRSERPRKYPRREVTDVSSWIGNSSIGNKRSDAKHNSIGDAHRSTEYVDTSRFKNTIDNRRERYYLEGKADRDRRKHHPISPTKLQASRAYQEKHSQRQHIFTPPGNKPVYQFVRPEGILLDRKLGHSHNAPIPISNRSTGLKRPEEQKPTQPRRRHQHLA